MKKKPHGLIMNQFKSSANSVSAHPIKSCSKVASTAYASKCTEITAVCCIYMQMQTASSVCSENKILIKKIKWLN